MTNMIYTAMPALPKKHHTNAVVLPSEWNTCPLSSIVEEISETVGTRKIETISISAGIGFVNQAEKFGRELSGKQYEKYIVLHKGDFSYNKGNSNIYPQGCIYRLNNRTEAAVPNVFESFRVSVGNPDYYEQLFLSGFLNRQLYSKINRGVRDNGLLNLKGKDFYSCEVPYPPLAEQERIAEILIQCDHVIELKEQKLDELKQLKKEFLRKMFPAKGCDTPEIRFPGFTGAWEQRKLIDEVTSIDTGKSKFTPQKSGVYEILGSTSVIGYDDSYDYEGDFLLTARVGANAGELYRHSGKVKISDNTVFIKGEQLDFIYYALLHFDIKRLSFGTGQPLVKASELKTQDIMMPVDSDERSAISTYFSNLDHLITLHQRELEETKTYKKTLAKLLLTGIVRVQG
jgi:type I restriction enzyme S subunit